VYVFGVGKSTKKFFQGPTVRVLLFAKVQAQDQLRAKIALHLLTSLIVGLKQENVKMYKKVGPGTFEINHLRSANSSIWS